MLEQKRARFLVAAGFLVAFCFITVSGGAQPEPPAPGWLALRAGQSSSGEKTADQVYKNIQVLKDLRATELDGVMNFMCAALGVGCTYCHTSSWDSDEKSGKASARRMILTTRSINEEHFNRNPAVTCYTCHRGQHNSVPNPPADLAILRPAEEAVTPPKPPPLPSIDGLIGRYIRAIGGEPVIAKIRTRVSLGTETTSDRMAPPLTIQVEIYQVTPDKLLIVRNDSCGRSEVAADGARGWHKDQHGLRELESRELADARRDGDLLRYVNLKAAYPQMRVLAREQLGDRDAYVVGATSREKLYFDAQTGLLIRKDGALKTAFGTIPEVTTFDDYRMVNGVKLPFSITWSRPPFSSKRRFVEIKLNATIDESKFGARAR